MDTSDDESIPVLDEHHEKSEKNTFDSKLHRESRLSKRYISLATVLNVAVATLFVLPRLTHQSDNQITHESHTEYLQAGYWNYTKQYDKKTFIANWTIWDSDLEVLDMFSDLRAKAIDFAGRSLVEIGDSTSRGTIEGFCENMGVKMNRNGEFRNCTISNLFVGNMMIFSATDVPSQTDTTYISKSAVCKPEKVCLNTTYRIMNILKPYVGVESPTMIILQSGLWDLSKPQTKLDPMEQSSLRAYRAGMEKMIRITKMTFPTTKVFVRNISQVNYRDKDYMKQSAKTRTNRGVAAINSASKSVAERMIAEKILEGYIDQHAMYEGFTHLAPDGRHYKHLATNSYFNLVLNILHGIK